LGEGLLWVMIGRPDCPVSVLKNGSLVFKEMYAYFIPTVS
jgi:hypothetical protein